MSARRPPGGCGQGGHGNGRHQRGARLGTDGELTRGAQERVQRQRPDDCPQTGDGRQPGHFGVRHHLGDEVRGDGYPGEQVTPQPGPLVVPRLPHAGQEPLDAAATIPTHGRARHISTVLVQTPVVGDLRRVIGPCSAHLDRRHRQGRIEGQTEGGGQVSQVG